MPNAGPDPAVRRQYEAFPYPPRDPADEATRLHTPSLACLPIAAHYLWGGHRAVDAGFRVLDAGCGTGDSAIFMGEQLRGTAAEVVACDLSEASLAIARERARVRGLDNIRFQQGRIEELPDRGLGAFDYIVASGVLHHLPVPAAGLAALRDLLKPDGGMGLMVYGPHGRMAIYQLQALLRLLAPPDWPSEQRLRVTRGVLQGLHRTHWAALGNELWKKEWDEGGDAGLYDLLLHPQDRAYSVAEIHDWLDAAALRLLRFQLPQLYDPDTFLPGMSDHLSAREREAAAELLFGRTATHQFFVTHQAYEPPALPGPDNEDAVPAWLVHDPAGLLAVVRDAPQLAVSAGVASHAIPLNPMLRGLLTRVDGQRSLGAILEETSRAVPGAKRRRLAEAWREMYTPLHNLDVLGLRSAA